MVQASPSFSPPFVCLLDCCFLLQGRQDAQKSPGKRLASNLTIIVGTCKIYGLDRNALFDETSIYVGDQGQRCTIRTYTCLSRLERKTRICSPNYSLSILNVEFKPQVLMTCR